MLSWPLISTGHNQWAFDRYDHLVDDSVMDVIGASELKLLSDRRDEFLPASAASRSRFKGPLGNTSLARYAVQSGEKAFQSLDPTFFGTAESIAADRAWSARYNRTIAIQRLANDEWSRTAVAAQEWVNQKIEARLPWLAEQCARLSLIAPCPVKGEIEDQEILSVAVGRSTEVWSDTVKWWRGGEALSSYHRSNPYSEFLHRSNGSKIFFEVKVDHPATLAYITGVALEDMPWQVQVAVSKNHEPYTGNSLLERLDPMDWLFVNPWQEFLKDFRLGYTKRELNAARKNLGLPRVVWADMENKEKRKKRW